MLWELAIQLTSAPKIEIENRPRFFLPKAKFASGRSYKRGLTLVKLMKFQIGFGWDPFSSQNLDPGHNLSFKSFAFEYQTKD
jgi:hypothetical protein